jgi:hypothetical protein
VSKRRWWNIVELYSLFNRDKLEELSWKLIPEVNEMAKIEQGDRGYLFFFYSSASFAFKHQSSRICYKKFHALFANSKHKRKYPSPKIPNEIQVLIQNWYSKTLELITEIEQFINSKKDCPYADPILSHCKKARCFLQKSQKSAPWNKPQSQYL